MSLRACLCVVLVLALGAACDAQCVYSSSHSSLAIDSGTGAPLHGAGGATLKDGFCISAADNDLKCQGQGRKPQGNDCPLSDNQLCCGNAYKNSRPLPKPTGAPGVCSFTTSSGAKVQVVRGFCVKDERKECDEFGMSGNIGQGANCPGATTCCELLKKPKVAAPAPAPAAPTTPDAPAPAAPVRDARAEIRAEFEAMRKKRADAAAAAAAAAAAPAPVVPVFPEGTYCPLPSYKAVSFVELEGESDSAALLESEAETGEPKLNAAQRAYCEKQRQAWLKSRAAKGDVQAQQALKQSPKKSTKAKSTKSKAKATKSKSAKKATKSKSKSAKKSVKKSSTKKSAKKRSASKKTAKKTVKKSAKKTAKKSVKKAGKKTVKKTAKKAAKKSVKKSSAKKSAKKSVKKAAGKKSVKKTAKKSGAKKSAKKSASKPSAKRAQCLSKCARLACTKKLPLTSSCKRIINNCNGTCPSDKAKAKRAAPKKTTKAPRKAAARKTTKKAAPKKAAARKTTKKAAARKTTKAPRKAAARKTTRKAAPKKAKGKRKF